MKEEIRRLASLEIRASIKGLRRMVALHRRDLAALRRLAARLEKSVAFLEGQERAWTAQRRSGVA